MWKVHFLFISLTGVEYKSIAGAGFKAEFYSFLLIHESLVLAEIIIYELTTSKCGDCVISS